MNTPMKAYACASGGVMFVPETLERKEPKPSANTSNDNRGASGKKA